MDATAGHLARLTVSAPDSCSSSTASLDNTEAGAAALAGPPCQVTDSRLAAGAPGVEQQASATAGCGAGGGASLGLADLPPECVRQALGWCTGATLGRAGAVCKAWRALVQDDALWEREFRTLWSPEAPAAPPPPPGCSPRRRRQLPYRDLCRRWRAGQPAGVTLVEGVHGGGTGIRQRQSMRARVNDAALSGAAAALRAWTVGDDGALVGWDLGLNRQAAAARDAHAAPAQCLALLAGDGCANPPHGDPGLVCTAGSDRQLKGWDPRCLGAGGGGGGGGSAASGAGGAQPAWVVSQAHYDEIFCMLPASPVGGVPLLLTGGGDEEAKLWDLRMLRSPSLVLRSPASPGQYELPATAAQPSGLSAGGQEEGVPEDDAVLLQFAPNTSPGAPVEVLHYGGHSGSIYCLAVDGARGVAYTGAGDHKINRYDLVTGEWLTEMGGHMGDVYGLALGADCLMSASDDGTVREWALYSAGDAPPEQEPAATLHVRKDAAPGVTARTHVTCLQGLGEGPEAVVAGTWEGALVLAQRRGRIGAFGRAVEKAALAGSTGPAGLEGKGDASASARQGDLPAAATEYLPVTCLAACDTLVFNGFDNGTTRMLRMTSDCVEG